MKSSHLLQATLLRCCLDCKRFCFLLKSVEKKTLSKDNGKVDTEPNKPTLPFVVFFPPRLFHCYIGHLRSKLNVHNHKLYGNKISCFCRVEVTSLFTSVRYIYENIVTKLVHCSLLHLIILLYLHSIPTLVRLC